MAEKFVYTPNGMRMILETKYAEARKKSAGSSQKKSGLHKGHKDDYTLALGKGEKRLKSVIDEGKFRP